MISLLTKRHFLCLSCLISSVPFSHQTLLANIQLQNCSKGYSTIGNLDGGLASLACVHTYTWNATRSMCCLNAASDVCGCQGNEECRNQLSHQLSVAENLGNDEDCPSDI
jgi:hypothetical protein